MKDDESNVAISNKIDESPQREQIKRKTKLTKKNVTKILAINKKL